MSNTLLNGRISRPERRLSLPSVEISWYDIVGLTGVALIIAAYFLLQAERISSKEISYSLLNAAGAGLVIFSLVFDFNFPAFIIEFFWLVISIYGIAKAITASR